MTKDTNTTLNEGAKVLFRNCAEKEYATAKLQRYKTVKETIGKITDAIKKLDTIENLKEVAERFSVTQGGIDLNTGHPNQYVITMQRKGDTKYGLSTNVEPSTDEQGNIIFVDMVAADADNREKRVSPNDFEEIVASKVYKCMTLPEKAALEEAYKGQSVNNDTTGKPDITQ